MRADQYVHIVRNADTSEIYRIDASYKNLVERSGLENTDLATLDKSVALAKLKAGLTITFEYNGILMECFNFKLQSLPEITVPEEAKTEKAKSA